MEAMKRTILLLSVLVALTAPASAGEFRGHNIYLLTGTGGTGNLPSWQDWRGW